MKILRSSFVVENTLIKMKIFRIAQSKSVLWGSQTRRSIFSGLFFFLFVFYAALTTNAASPSVHLAVIGDYGCGCTAESRMAALLKRVHQENPIDVVLTTGDNIYGEASYSPLKHFMFWRKRGGDRALFKKRFDRYFLPLVKEGVRFHAVLGNHDYRTRHGQDVIQDKRRFGILNEKGYYRFGLGGTPENPMVEIFMLNSVRLKKGDPDQISWLHGVLRKSRARWRMVVLHHPLYGPIGNHRPDVGLRQKLEGIFRTSSVQFLFAGHNHFYARVHPSSNLIQFIVGNGGAPIHHARPDITTRCLILRHGFLSLFVNQKRIQFQSYAVGGRVLDEGIVVRTPTGFTVESEHCKVRYHNAQSIH